MYSTNVYAISYIGTMDTCTPALHQAQLVLPSRDLPADISFFSDLGFKQDNIFPSDNPMVATVSGHGLHIRLDKGATCPPATIHILSDSPELIGKGEKEITAPNGTTITVLPKTYKLKIPSTQHKFEIVRREGSSPWVVGRAGMLYRDLIPNRLGGSIVASHIHIPKGGPVPDKVHFHTIRFQLIFCFNGWVRLVYEDQGDPFILSAGDCVIQPPEIRHRVLEASDDFHVIEIGVPADHMTTMDHEMQLPTATYHPQQEFQGQKFCHNVAKNAIWLPWRINGFQYRDTGINTATKGLASVHVARPLADTIPSGFTSHHSDILFTFILNGKTDLSVKSQPQHILGKGDAFVMPPDMPYAFSNYTTDLELLEVSLPGNFETKEQLN